MNIGRDKIESELDGLLEELAAIEHERWSHWQRHLHDKGTMQPNGTMLLPANLVKRWEHQSRTDYADLTEQEKESDREQVRRYLPIIVAALSHEKS